MVAEFAMHLRPAGDIELYPLVAVLAVSLLAEARPSGLDNFVVAASPIPISLAELLLVSVVLACAAVPFLVLLHSAAFLVPIEVAGALPCIGIPVVNPPCVVGSVLELVVAPLPGIVGMYVVRT